MSVATGKRTRTIYKTQINNSVSIGADQTLIPVLIKNITRDVTKTGNNPGTPYYKIVAVCMSKEPTFIKMRAKKKDTKKQKVDDDTEDLVKDEEMEDGGAEEPKPKGTTVSSGDEFLVTTYDRTAATLTSGIMVKLALTTDLYEERFTFMAGKVMVDRNSNILCDKNYDALVLESKLSDIPTVNNVSEDDFPVGTDEKYMNRTFVLPLSVENSKFANVEIQIGDDETGRFFGKIKDDPGQYVGLNTQSGDKTTNMFKVAYTPKEDGMPKTMMTFAYALKWTEGNKPTLVNPWDCFGCANVDLWQKVAPRFIFNAKEWYVYGYSNLRKLEGILAVKDEEADDVEDGEQWEYSTGFITRMAVNIKATVETVGIPLSLSFIEQHYGGDSSYANDHEYDSHPLNVAGWKVNVKRNKAFVINFTDLSSDETEKFLKDVVKNKSDVKFYGIFADDRPYEFVGDDREEQIAAAGLVPDMVFAINE